MNELNKLYDVWSKENPANAEIKDTWNKALEYMYEHSPEIDREKISAYMIEYGQLIEQRAFLAGFSHAFSLLLESLSINS